MSPTVLDNDVLMVVSSLTPEPHDIVLLRFAPNPLLPGITKAIVRYAKRGARAFVTKDSQRYEWYERKVVASDILGVVVEILPRRWRSPHENHFAVESEKAMLRVLGRKIEPDMGLLSCAKMDRFASIFDIPDCELLDGRLPRGPFRASAKADQPHVGIGTRDIVIIDPKMESCVGDLIVATSDQGDPMFGVLRRDGLTDLCPGQFWLGSTDPDSDVRVGGEAWDHLGTVARVDNHSHVALAAGHSHADRVVASRGRKELL